MNRRCVPFCLCASFDSIDIFTYNYFLQNFTSSECPLKNVLRENYVGGLYGKEPACNAGDLG